jgi:hypothetical protein
MYRKHQPHAPGLHDTEMRMTLDKNPRGLYEPRFNPCFFMGRETVFSEPSILLTEALNNKGTSDFVQRLYGLGFLSSGLELERERAA